MVFSDSSKRWTAARTDASCSVSPVSVTRRVLPLLGLMPVEGGAGRTAPAPGLALFFFLCAMSFLDDVVGNELRHPYTLDAVGLAQVAEVDVVDEVHVFDEDLHRIAV